MCITCFTKRPEAERSVCSSCAKKAYERTIRRRALHHQRAEWHSLVTEHERAGDRAQQHHLFDDAVRHYKEALDVPAIVPETRLRLVKKLSSVSFLSGDPMGTAPWRGDVPDSYFGDSQHAEKALDRLFQMIRLQWVNAKTEDAVLLCEQAVQIARTYGIHQLRKTAVMYLAGYLKNLGRFEEAMQCLEREEITSADALRIQVNYYYHKGFIYAMRGLASESYKNFEKALDCVKRDKDLYRTATALGDYGLCAMSLGDTERGKALYEQALLVVRRNHMGWLVPYLCLGYAEILARTGQYDAAHSYLVEALASDAHAALLEERFVVVGIPIALYLRDEATLIKCTRPDALELAFQSREPAWIGPVTAAFAHLYALQGHKRRAQIIVHRALEFVTYFDENSDFVLAIAQYGSQADIARALVLLEARMQLPSARVAEACSYLFRAFVHRRMRERKQAQQMAATAAKCFDNLHWYAYGNLARSLIPSARPIAPTSTSYGKHLYGPLQTLTKREQQVAELVLQGHTNGGIAQQLAIREHTVEKHLSSIMNRLGIRSRYQLGETLAKQAP
jgi:DNA-binding NarL/FixJ family response regulator